MLNTRIIRGMGALIIAATGAVMLTGCQGHGDYVQEGIDIAQERVAEIKSGTEWQMARQQFLAGDLEKALKTVDQSIRLNDDVAKSHLLRGRILLELGRLEDARAALINAETYDAEMAEIQYYLGITEERFTRHDRALERYLKAADLEPDDSQYLVAAAEMLILQDDLPGARAMLESREERFEYNAAIQQTLAHIAALDGEYEVAVRHLETARTLAPDDPAVLEELVRTQMRAGDFANAAIGLDQLDGMFDEPRRDLTHMHVECLLAMNRNVEARTMLEQLTAGEEGEDDLQAWTLLGEVAIALDDDATLRQAATRIIALAPHRSEGYVFRALNLRRRGELEKALIVLDDALAYAEGDSNPLILRSLILADMDRYDEAARDAARAVSLNPEDPTARELMRMYNPSAITTVDPLSQ